jgi:hypothetical protein
MRSRPADEKSLEYVLGLDLAEANERGEFIAFADDALGGGGAASHGAADDILRDFAEVSFGFRSSSYDLSRRHKISLPQRLRDTEKIERIILRFSL